MTAENTWRDLVEKLQTAEKAIAFSRGPFILFVLAEREAALGKWDLLVSATWLESSRIGIQQMVDELNAHITLAGWLQLASITPLPPSSLHVQGMARQYNVQHSNQEVINTFWNDVFIPHGYVITASLSPAQPQKQSVSA